MRTSGYNDTLFFLFSSFFFVFSTLNHLIVTYCIMMGGLIDDDQDIASALTLALVEEAGNNILGTKSIESTQSSSGVTATTELKETELEEDRMLNVIDTPGMFDSSANPESIDQDLASALTLVLVEETGNGESAIGNSIESTQSSSGVTATTELKVTKLEDCRMLNVIDTPGMFDSSADPESIQKEIVRCIHMSSDGIHAVLLVFSICSRFSDEEHAVICGLVGLFGNRTYDYMIIVFTSRDELEANEKSLDDFLCGCSEPLKEILRLCGNRHVLFDNRTKDETKKSSQVQQLLSYVSNVLEKNDGKPYTSEIFAMFKEVTENEPINLTDRKLKSIIELLESKFIEIELKLQKKKLEEEQAARVKAELRASEVQNKSEENVNRLEGDLANANEALKHWQCGFVPLEAKNRLVALKPNEEEIKLEWWISSLDYISKQQSVEDRHTLSKNRILVSEPMSDKIPKDVKVCEKLDKLLELGLKEEGKVDRLLELVQQVEEGYRKQKFVVEGEEEEEIDTEHVKNILDEDYAAAYGTHGPSVEVLSPGQVVELKKKS
ncbi:hypothetical protein L1987_53537 [Smallanthus sonchifolius]|uniref:Uncharacterized protein n=1 Tax=Smallanthus sonchifolius TaxID=185202 RepID=A0ACB9EW70_9ASTR|nr:hypothetical protein L1987_53537 [Smallanthus sonchifolius]